MFSVAGIRHLIVGLSVVIVSICSGMSITGWLNYKFAPDPVPDYVFDDFKGTGLNSHGAEKNKLDYRAVIERNLFGGDPYEHQKPVQKKEEKRPEDLPLARLKLKLKGTIVDVYEKYSAAFIEDMKNKRQDVYHVGDKVKNALIKKIARTYVIINTGSRDEVLAMDPDDLRKGTLIKKTSSGQFRVPRKLVNEAVTNLSGLMRDAHFSPYTWRGKPYGFKITRIRVDSLYDRLGLKNGDVLVEINGQKLDGPETFFSLYNRINSLKEVKLKIRRRGREKILVYQVSD